VGKEHPNFYENMKEAHMRLRNTVVMYESEPYYIFAITDHMKDGIFRVYMYPIGDTTTTAAKECMAYVNNYPADHPDLGGMLDKALGVHGKDCGVLRKHMNSPAFNRFRPFPLGMCNLKGKGTHYVERQPTRHTPQGLTASMLYDTEIVTAAQGIPVKSGVSIQNNDFRNCVLGKYPTAQECLSGLSNPKLANEAAAFHRQFALARGPIGMIFFAYKTDIVGVLPDNDFSELRLGKDYRHVREVVQELQLFNTVSVA
jgi:hypothetical protein